MQSHKRFVLGGVDINLLYLSPKEKNHHNVIVSVFPPENRHGNVKTKFRG